jgi:D-beta-D-heptose 7-phosphate kinase/D-beta-D-heptose 1-phosphate adenosyltransferase
MLDRWVEGDMRRISPEAPVPIVLQKQVTDSPGGAANVAMNIKSLGGNVFFAAGVNEQQESAQRLQQFFQQVWPIPVAWCHCSRLYTPTKTRFLVGGKQVLRVDDERPVHSPSHGDAMLRAIYGVSGEESNVKAVVVSDYSKGSITPSLRQQIRELSVLRGWPIFLDCKPDYFRDWIDPQRRAQIHLKVNLSEALQFSKQEGNLHPGLSMADSAAEVATEFISRASFTTVTVTCGSQGVVYWERGQLHRIPTTPRYVYDVTGAGDIFMAAMAVGYVEGHTLHEALLRANIAAGLAVQRTGLKRILRDEWEDGVVEHRGWAGKMMGVDAATAYATRKRNAGNVVVLANGCFDALHVGHIQTLAFAKQQGDVLIVAYNDDDSVKALKGPDRPIIAEAFRGAQLAMLGSVDCAVRFGGSVEDLVRRIHPDVLVKGAQYRDTVVPGADYVASHGGVVAFAPMIPRVSTTGIEQQR